MVAKQINKYKYEQNQVKGHKVSTNIDHTKPHPKFPVGSC